MPIAPKQPQTLYDKVFQDHVVDERLDGTVLLYISSEVQILFTIISTLTISFQIDI